MTTVNFHTLDMFNSVATRGVPCVYHVSSDKHKGSALEGKAYMKDGVAVVDIVGYKEVPIEKIELFVF